MDIDKALRLLLRLAELERQAREYRAYVVSNRDEIRRAIEEE